MVVPRRKQIGEILFEMGYISRFQLQRGLRKQEKGDGRRLGEILVELGFINRAQLDKALVVEV